MNYYSNINHRAFMEFYDITGIKIRIDDTVILAWMYKYFLTDKCVKIIRDETLFMWVAYGNLIKQNPQLWIDSKATISRRLDKLIDAGFLIKHTENGNTGFRTYFSFTPLYEAIANSEYRVGDIENAIRKTIEIDDSALTESSKGCNKTVKGGATKPSYPVDVPVIPALTESSYNEYIIDTYINKHINDKEIRAFGFLIKTDPERVINWIMQNKSMIQNIGRMIDMFDNKVDIEGLEFTSKKLSARLNNFASNWIYNQNKHNHNPFNNQNTDKVTTNQFT